MNDRYTRVMLTIIAVALAILTCVETVRLFAPTDVVAAGKATGGSLPQRVTVCNDKGDFCANVDETGRFFVK